MLQQSSEYVKQIDELTAKLSDALSLITQLCQQSSDETKALHTELSAAKTLSENLTQRVGDLETALNGTENFTSLRRTLQGLKSCRPTWN